MYALITLEYLFSIYWYERQTTNGKQQANFHASFLRYLTDLIVNSEKKVM